MKGVTLTLAQLEKWGACEDHVARGILYFGTDRLRLTRTRLAEMAALELDLHWLAGRMLSDRRRAAYERVIAPALAAYQRAIAPALAAYQQAIAPALAAYQQAIAPALAAYQQAIAPAWAAYRQATAPAWAAYRQATATALADELGLP